MRVSDGRLRDDRRHGALLRICARLSARSRPHDGLADGGLGRGGSSLVEQYVLEAAGDTGGQRSRRGERAS